MHVDIAEVINRIEEWRGRKVTYEILGGGITNHNYTVQVDNETFVVRIPGAGTDIFIDRDNELECSRAAGEAGVAPRVLHHLKPENITVIPFIRGKTLTTPEIAQDNGLIRRIVHAIKSVHDCVSFTNSFNP